MKLIVHIPSRGRPDQLLKTIAQYQQLAEGPVTILLSLDLDDEVMKERREEFQRLNGVLVCWGPSEGKIKACNRDLKGRAWDVVIGASDDMVPIVHGYDTKIALHFVNGTDRCLWCSDDRQFRICTIPVMGRAAFDALGYLYFDQYDSYYADDEWTERWGAAGKLVRVPGKMFRHNHWIFGAARFDALYKRNKEPKRRDHSLYLQRQSAGFP